jgi:hypothetical protein
VAPPAARSPNDGDDSEIRHDSGCYESRRAVVFACILTLDIRGIEKNLASNLEVEAALSKNGVVFVRVPRKAVFEVRIYGALYSAIRVYAIARVDFSPS